MGGGPMGASSEAMGEAGAASGRPGAAASGPDEGPLGWVLESDPERIPWGVVVAWLRTTPWAQDRDEAFQRRVAARSFNLVGFVGGAPVAYVRAIHDGLTHAWVADMVVAPERRGQGWGAALLGALLAHPELAEVRTWRLSTPDAGPFYARFGFAPLAEPGRLWERRQLRPIP